MALGDLTREAILKAIDEHDLIEQKAFIAKYGFRKSRGYLLIWNGHAYDSKAIAGAAHGNLPGREPLSWSDFSGGKQTVQKVLIDLGFEVTAPSEIDAPMPGEILSNDEISKRFRVGNSGGMRKNRAANLLVLFSDPFKGLYQDRWDGPVLHYTGMGRVGSQVLEGNQNETLYHSAENNVTIHLFEALEPQKYTYAGIVRLSDAPYQEEQLDSDQMLRSVWMFPLQLMSGSSTPTPTESQARAITEHFSKEAKKLSDEAVLSRAKSAKSKPTRRTATAVVYMRDAFVAESAKRLAKGICDLCGKSAPFHGKTKEPYLECHHVVWLAKGGEDTIENTVALCPNCHRKMHVLNERSDRQRLEVIAIARANKIR